MNNEVAKNMNCGNVNLWIWIRYEKLKGRMMSLRYVAAASGSSLLLL